MMESVAVFGAGETGKSSLVARFLGGAFEENHKPTIEDYHCSRIYCGEILFHLNIIDTAGSFEFPAMERLTMEKSDAFIFVYSIDNVKSFEKVKSGLKRLGEVKDMERVPVIVVCNKADLADIAELRALQKKMDDKDVDIAKETTHCLTHDSEVSRKRTIYDERDFVLKQGCRFLLTSAKFRWNVNRIFYELFAEHQSVLKNNYLTRDRAFLNTMKVMWRKISFHGSQT